jgi:hypothetical protein
MDNLLQGLGSPSRAVLRSSRRSGLALLGSLHWTQIRLVVMDGNGPLGHAAGKALNFPSRGRNCGGRMEGPEKSSPACSWELVQARPLVPTEAELCQIHMALARGPHALLTILIK